MDLAVQDLRLTYRQPDGSPTTVIALPDLNLRSGTRVGLTGPSGSGKSSLLLLLAGIELPSGGTISWGDTSLTTLSEASRDRWRRHTIGLVFQDFHLIPGLSALDNVLLPMRFGRVGIDQSTAERARALLHEVGVETGRRDIVLLSRGEQQRVAIARALLHMPPIVLADEPTASLDGETAGRVGDLLVGLATRTGATLIVAAHDPALLARMDRVLPMTGGTFQERSA